MRYEFQAISGNVNNKTQSEEIAFELSYSDGHIICLEA